MLFTLKVRIFVAGKVAAAQLVHQKRNPDQRVAAIESFRQSELKGAQQFVSGPRGGQCLTAP
jgi:hypothetical protein